MVLTQLTYNFNQRTVEPFQPATAGGCYESTSRSQTFSSIRILGKDYAVIPCVTYLMTHSNSFLTYDFTIT